VSSDPVAHFPKDAVRNLVKKPLVVIDPGINATSLLADVVLPCAIAGIEVEGTAYRMDRVPLPLKQVVKPQRAFLPDQEILSRILREVRRIKKRREVVENG
jgi:formylmethanofuran dehydrogenase subunit B